MSAVANYIANVILPVTLLNLNENTLTKLNTFKACPACNVTSTITSTSSASTTNTNGITNPNLTNFGNFFLPLMVAEFNTLFGTDYKASDFDINSSNNDDQNSLCCYILTNIANNFTITCYIELGNQIHINMRFDAGDYSSPDVITES